MFLNFIKNFKKKESDLKEILDFQDIRTRRPFNEYSFQIEKTIYNVLSSKQDNTGQILVRLIITVFEKLGYVAKNNDGFKDKKKDILLFQANTTTPFATIQCKSYSPQNSKSRLLKNDIASFVGYTEEFKDNRLFITSSYFDKGVINDFSDKVILIDRIGLIHLLIKVFPNETMNALNSFSLYELEYNCPKCTIGKLQQVYYAYNNIFKCTNCGYRFKNKDGKPNFSTGVNDKY